MSQPNRSLARILTDLKDASEDANRDLDNVPLRMLPSFQLRKRESQDALPGLKAEYRDKLLASAVGIFAFGPLDKQVEFAAHAQRSADCLVFDVDECYQKFATPVWESLGRSGEFSITQTMLLVGCIRQFAIENGMTGSLPSLGTRDDACLKSTKETLEYVKALIHAAMGDQLLTAFFANQIVDRAIAAEIVDPPLKVVVVNATNAQSKPDSMASYFRITRALNLDVETEVNESFAIGVVEKVLKRSEPKAPPAAKPPGKPKAKAEAETKSASTQEPKPETQPAVVPEGTNPEQKEKTNDGN